MKRNINIFILMLIVWASSSMQSCKEDFLDIDPVAAQATGNFYKTMDDADQAVAAAYSTLYNFYWERDLLIGHGSIASDDAEAGGEYVNEVPNAEQVNWLEHSPTLATLENIYGVLFRGIYFSNLVIQNVPGVAESDPDANQSLLNDQIAEAHYLRALNYFYLTIVFGGMPYVDEPLGPSEYQQPRAPIKQIHELIEADLKLAIDELPARSEWGEANIGRASKGAAQALLSRLYLFESSYARNYPDDDRFDGMTERWDEALQYAEDVIESEEYELVGINGETYETWYGPETNGFRYIHAEEGDNSPEGIFEIQCVQEGLDYGYARGSALAKWTSARYYYDEDSNSVATSYWGLNLPTQDLVDAFEDGDPRYETTISEEWDSIQIAGSEWVPISMSSSVTNYYTAKFQASSANFRDISSEWDHSPLNIFLIRYAEVYLNAAEAAFMDGQDGKALEYLNKVRERARNCGNTGVPADYTEVTFERIVNERRIELAMEGHRFFDLVRWRLAEEELTRTSTDGRSVVFEYPKHTFYPLPQQEIAVSKGVLEQYPGWD